MSDPRYKRKSAAVPEQITIRNKQFAKFVSRRKGVSARAMSSAVRLLTEGVLEAMGEGYNVQLIGLGTWEVRLMPARMRYHRITKVTYMAEPFYMAYFKKSPTLIKTVREISKARIQGLTVKATMPIVGCKRGI